MHIHAVRSAILITISAIAAGQTFEFPLLKEGVLQERLRLAHKDNAERHGSKQPNVICDVPNQNDEAARKIIVGAHFDTASGDGIIDNWSGAVLLPSLAEFVRRSPRRHSFEFVGFAAEEKGLLGSRAYLKSLAKEERLKVSAVITMDSLGLTPTKCWPNGSSRELMTAAARVAAALKLDFRGVNVDEVGTTDSATFQEARLPVLSVHSVTQETWPIINSKKDVWSAISWHDYYDTHRFLSALLVYLDSLP